MLKLLLITQILLVWLCFTSSTDVPATINGTSGNVKHQTSVGEVDYGSTTRVLYFQSNSTNSVGSEFKIEYTFRPSYSYSIVVNTRSINNSGATPWLRLTILLPTRFCVTNQEILFNYFCVLGGLVPACLGSSYAAL
jgi:hypothetical protein